MEQCDLLSLSLTREELQVLDKRESCASYSEERKAKAAALAPMGNVSSHESVFSSNLMGFRILSPSFPDSSFAPYLYSSLPPSFLPISFPSSLPSIPFPPALHTSTNIYSVDYGLGTILSMEHAVMNTTTSLPSWKLHVSGEDEN